MKKYFTNLLLECIYIYFLMEVDVDGEMMMTEFKMM